MNLPKTLTHNPSIHKTEEDLTELARELGMEYKAVNDTIDWETYKPFQENKKTYCDLLLKETEKVEEAYELVTKKVQVPEGYAHFRGYAV